MNPTTHRTQLHAARMELEQAQFRLMGLKTTMLAFGVFLAADDTLPDAEHFAVTVCDTINNALSRIDLADKLIQTAGHRGDDHE